MQISFEVSKLISAYVFATWIVQFLFFLNTKFQASGLLLLKHRMICVGPIRKPHCWLSHDEAQMSHWTSLYAWGVLICQMNSTTFCKKIYVRRKCRGLLHFKFILFQICQREDQWETLINIFSSNKQEYFLFCFLLHLLNVN